MPTEDESLIFDSNRYDVHHSKLEHYTYPDVKKLLKSKFVTGQSQDQIMKNLLNMSDSDDEVEDDRKLKKLKKKVDAHSDSENEEGENSDEEPAVPVLGNARGGTKGQIAMEEIRKEKEKEKLRREEEVKKKEEKEKAVSLFLGESHGHYKMGIFVRIELQIPKKFSRALIPEYPVVLCSLRH